MLANCRRCNKEFEVEEFGFTLETPNYLLVLCLECAIEVEDDIKDLVCKGDKK